jgi:hypothetical protein
VTLRDALYLAMRTRRAFYRPSKLDGEALYRCPSGDLQDVESAFLPAWAWALTKDPNAQLQWSTAAVFYGWGVEDVLADDWTFEEEERP